MNKFSQETITRQAESKNQQCWRCASIVDVNYISNGITRNHVANQFHISLIRLSASLGVTPTDEIVKQCKAIIEKRLFTRLARSDCNYGIEGLKRWAPEVITITVTPVFKPDEEDE